MIPVPDKLTIPAFMKIYNVTENQVNMALYRSKTLDYETIISNVKGWGGERRKVYILINERVNPFLNQLRHKTEGKIKTGTKICHNGVEVLDNVLGKVCLGMD